MAKIQRREDFHKDVLEAEAKRSVEEKQENLKSSFDWADDSSPEDESNLPPLVANQQDIDECVSLLSDQIIKTLTSDFLEIVDDSILVATPIDPSIHPLLTSRFNEELCLESRLEVFDSIRQGLIDEFEKQHRREELNNKIEQLLPPQRKRFASAEVLLCDDALAIGNESNMLSIEVNIQFAQR